MLWHCSVVAVLKAKRTPVRIQYRVSDHAIFFFLLFFSFLLVSVALCIFGLFTFNESLRRSSLMVQLIDREIKQSPIWSFRLNQLEKNSYSSHFFWFESDFHFIWIRKNAVIYLFFFFFFWNKTKMEIKRANEMNFGANFLTNWLFSCLKLIARFVAHLLIYISFDYCSFWASMPRQLPIMPRREANEIKPIMAPNVLIVKLTKSIMHLSRRFENEIHDYICASETFTADLGVQNQWQIFDTKMCQTV